MGKNHASQYANFGSLRVNTAGVPLTPQEMRHALNQGPAAIFIKELADMESFKKATNYSVESKRMQDRDFVNRFIAFYIGYQDYMGDLDMIRWGN